MTLDIAYHKKLLIIILKDIFSDPEVGPYVGFKGGTAALLFYGLERFSVDLDFDLLDEKQGSIVFAHVMEILEHYGTIKIAREKRYSYFFLLSYDQKLEGAYNIKVEVNKRSFGSKYVLRQFLGIPMQVMVQEDMAANKMVAMLERIGKTNRDIFDVWFFLKHRWSVNTAIIKLRTGMDYKTFLRKCIEHLEKMSDRNILSGIGELLDDKEKKWAKNHLRQETIQLLEIAQVSLS